MRIKTCKIFFCQICKFLLQFILKLAKKNFTLLNIKNTIGEIFHDHD